MKTGAELKARREELKITQQDLADEIGVSRTQLSRMENGKIEIPLEILAVLYDLLYAKHEKPKLQFSDLEVGDYVYVRDDLVDGVQYGGLIFFKVMKKGLHKLGVFSSIGNPNIDGFSYSQEMIDLSRSMKKEDYLKMNEKEGVSFDDLIDAAVQAKKEGIINHLIIGNSMIDFNYDYDDKNNHFDEEEVKEGIEFIQSLYTEEFVIECEDDIKRIKAGAKITLKNDLAVNVIKVNMKMKTITSIIRRSSYILGIEFLKGATVKQSK